MTQHHSLSVLAINILNFATRQPEKDTDRNLLYTIYVLLQKTTEKE